MVLKLLVVMSFVALASAFPHWNYHHRHQPQPNWHQNRPHHGRFNENRRFHQPQQHFNHHNPYWQYQTKPPFVIPEWFRNFRNQRIPVKKTSVDQILSKIEKVTPYPSVASARIEVATVPSKHLRTATVRRTDSNGFLRNFLLEQMRTPSSVPENVPEVTTPKTIISSTGQTEDDPWSPEGRLIFESSTNQPNQHSPDIDVRFREQNSTEMEHATERSTQIDQKTLTRPSEIELQTEQSIEQIISQLPEMTTITIVIADSTNYETLTPTDDSNTFSTERSLKTDKDDLARLITTDSMMEATTNPIIGGFQSEEEFMSTVEPTESTFDSTTTKLEDNLTTTDSTINELASTMIQSVFDSTRISTEKADPEPMVEATTVELIDEPKILLDEATTESATEPTTTEYILTRTESTPKEVDTTTTELASAAIPTEKTDPETSEQFRNFESTTQAIDEELQTEAAALQQNESTFVITTEPTTTELILTTTESTPEEVDPTTTELATSSTPTETSDRIRNLETTTHAIDEEFQSEAAVLQQNESTLVVITEPTTTEYILTTTETRREETDTTTTELAPTSTPTETSDQFRNFEKTTSTIDEKFQSKTTVLQQDENSLVVTTEPATNPMTTEDGDSLTTTEPMNDLATDPSTTESMIDPIRLTLVETTTVEFIDEPKILRDESTETTSTESATISTTMEDEDSFTTTKPMIDLTTHQDLQSEINTSTTEPVIDSATIPIDPEIDDFADLTTTDSLVETTTVEFADELKILRDESTLTESAELASNSTQTYLTNDLGPTELTVDSTNQVILNAVDETKFLDHLTTIEATTTATTTFKPTEETTTEPTTNEDTETFSSTFTVDDFQKEIIGTQINEVTRQIGRIVSDVMEDEYFDSVEDTTELTDSLDSVTLV